MTASMPWGKYKGEPLTAVPSSYLCWVLEDSNASPALKADVENELADRFGDDPPPPPPPEIREVVVEKVVERRVEVLTPFAEYRSAERVWIARILEAGYRQLAQTHHPDRGGDTRRMQEINAVMDRLRRQLGNYK